MNSSNTFKLWYPSTMFSGETILMPGGGYETEEEAWQHTDKTYPCVDWVEYSKRGRYVVAKSYDDFNR